MKCFDSEERFSYDDFRGIIARLRQECPWDRAQTFDSMKSSFFGELMEVAAGIRIASETGEASNLCEELGDLLMVLMLTAQIAEEKELFSIEDVIDGISRKMIRRHPHVFEDGFRDENGELIYGWNEIKKREKAGKTPEKLAREQAALEEELKLLDKYRGNDYK